MQHLQKQVKTAMIVMVTLSCMIIGQFNLNINGNGNAGEPVSKSKLNKTRSNPTSPVMLGYYRSWDSTPTTSIPWRSLTHVSHAFAELREDGSLEWQARIPSKSLTALAHQHRVKALLSVGGAGSGDQLFQIAKSPIKKKTFLASIAKTIQTFGYDGVDLDWEFPTSTSSEAFHDLLSDLKSSLKTIENSQPLILSAAIPASNWHGQWIDAEKLARDCDLIQIMAYDFTGPWSSRALHHSAANATNENLNAGGYSVTHSLNYWLDQRNLPAAKCLVGLPFYGRLFKAEEVEGVIDKQSGNVNPITLQYSKVDSLLASGWQRTTNVDPWLKSPDNQKLFAFDDAKSVRSKCILARERGCGGAFVWALGDENPSKSELLRTAFDTLTD